LQERLETNYQLCYEIRTREGSFQNEREASSVSFFIKFRKKS
jgi:hypothetical protein